MICGFTLNSIVEPSKSNTAWYCHSYFPSVVNRQVVSKWATVIYYHRMVAYEEREMYLSKFWRLEV